MKAKKQCRSVPDMITASIADFKERQRTAVMSGLDAGFYVYTKVGEIKLFLPHERTEGYTGTCGTVIRCPYLDQFRRIYDCVQRSVLFAT